MSIYESAVKKPVTTILIFAAIVIIGVFSLMRLPINLLPEFDANTIMVITSYPGASAADIENNVSRPIENALNGVSDLKHITSQSKENMSLVTLEFEYGIDIDVATNDVRDKLEMVKSVLPDASSTPIIFKFGADDIPILMLSVSADESTNALYKIVDDKVVNSIARIKGVGSVSIMGIPQRRIYVYCDPYKLEAYNMSIETIAAIIGQENRNSPSGSVNIGSDTYSIRVEQEFDDPYEMANLVIGNSNGRIVYLRDVATISDQLQERSQETYHDGKKGGMIVIQKQSGSNSVQIARKVFDMLPNIKESLPPDVHLGIVVDTTENIINTINSLKETIYITFVIVMLVVFFFLGRWRATFIIILTIPISLVASFAYLLVTGNTLNIISLSSLSIAIGMVVDDAIVVLENVTTHIERGSRPKQAAIYATNEVAISVVASTLTMLAVFLPLTMVTGMAGILFEQLGWIISIIMIISTIGALSLTPVLCSLMLRLNPHKGKVFKFFFTPIEKMLDALDEGYSKLLNWAVHHRSVVVTGAIAIFIGTMVGLGPQLKTEFFPTQDNARIQLSIKLPIGTRQEITREVGFDILHEFTEKFPEIIRFTFNEGQSDEDNTFGALQSTGSHVLSAYLTLTNKVDRKRGLTEIADLMREELAKHSEIREFSVVEGGSSGMGGQSAVEIEIYGYDFDETDKAANDVMQAMKELKGFTQVNVSRDEYVPEYQVLFDREKLSINGLNVTTASSYIRNRINGATASFFREDGEEYDIIVRYEERYRESIEDIENILMYNSLGKAIRIKDVAEVVEFMTPPTIERKDRERVVTVTGVIANGVAMSDMVDASIEIMEKVDLPTDLDWALGGTYEDQQDTFKDLFTLMLLVVILVFIVMAAQFESLLSPFVIMFSVPFAFTGVLIGLVLNNTPLSVMALIGTLILLGVVVKNGIVLIDYTILCRERGMSIVRAVVTAGKSRLRPVLMTTLTTVLGMLPLAMGKGEGAEMWQSMGLTVAWGLAFSTLITLVIVPVVYCIFAGGNMKRIHKHIE